jgi:ABC-type lipoprotein export system ATPase subunit
MISGGTGSGKTTLLNALSQKIDAGERIVTYNLYNNIYEMDSDDKDFTVFNFAINAGRIP